MEKIIFSDLINFREGVKIDLRHPDQKFLDDFKKRLASKKITLLQFSKRNKISYRLFCQVLSGKIEPNEYILNLMNKI